MSSILVSTKPHLVACMVDRVVTFDCQLSKLITAWLFHHFYRYAIFCCRDLFCINIFIYI